jgi:hypothetical protein
MAVEGSGTAVVVAPVMVQWPTPDLGVTLMLVSHASPPEVDQFVLKARRNEPRPPVGLSTMFVFEGSDPPTVVGDASIVEIGRGSNPKKLVLSKDKPGVVKVNDVTSERVIVAAAWAAARTVMLPVTFVLSSSCHV